MLILYYNKDNVNYEDNKASTVIKKTTEAKQ